LKIHFIVFYTLIACISGLSQVNISVYVDSVLSDVSHHPVGINMDYLVDDDNYLMPKKSTVEALKDMGVKYLRYPGGNKSDFYLFSEAPYEKSIPGLARTGKQAIGDRSPALNEDFTAYSRDVLDFDEFISICREIDAKPVIVVAADEYLVEYTDGSKSIGREQLIRHAAEWVRYANIKKGYNVKYWMIGNESWHKQNQNSSAEIYANDVIAFSKAMKSVDPNIAIIPNGKSQKFWETVLSIAGDYIDYVTISNYSIEDMTGTYETYRDTVLNVMHFVNLALEAIDKHTTSHTGKDKLKVIVAEYGPYAWNTWGNGFYGFVNDMGANIINFEMTARQLLQPRIEFSCFWNTRWIGNDNIEYKAKYNGFDAIDWEGNFNANGYGLMILGNFLGEKMVYTTSTTHLRSYASYSPSSKKLFVYLINKIERAVNVKLDFINHKILSLNQAWELKGKSHADKNPTWRKLKSINTSGNVNISGTSIMVIEYILH